MFRNPANAAIRYVTLAVVGIVAVVFLRYNTIYLVLALGAVVLAAVALFFAETNARR